MELKIFENFAEASAFAKSLAQQGIVHNLKRNGAVWAVEHENYQVRPQPNESDIWNVQGSEYWVGKIGRALFIYDESIQSSDPASVTLFSYSFDEPVKLDKTIVEERIKQARGPEIDDVLKRFNNWKKFYSSALKRVNEQPGPDTVKLIQAVKGGVIKAYWGRKAHCYRCGNSLTGTRGNICHKCFWITCSCGACGCGFSHEA